DGIRDFHVTGVQTCALPISEEERRSRSTALLRADLRQRCRGLVDLRAGFDDIQLLGDGRHRNGRGVRPLEVRVRRGTDGAGAGLEVVTGDEQLVRVEEPLDALVLVEQGWPDLTAMVRVAQQLID